MCFPPCSPMYSLLSFSPMCFYPCSLVYFKLSFCAMCLAPCSAIYFLFYFCSMCKSVFYCVFIFFVLSMFLLNAVCTAFYWTFAICPIPISHVLYFPVLLIVIVCLPNKNYFLPPIMLCCFVFFAFITCTRTVALLPHKGAKRRTSE